MSANSKKSQITMKELGYIINADECIEKASNIGNNGNLIQRYKEVMDAKNGKMIYKSDVQTIGNTRKAQTYKYVYVNDALQSKEQVEFPDSSYSLQ